MLKLRLQRTGRKGHAQYRIVVTEHTAPPKSGSLELLGSYDPHLKKLAIKEDRLNHWISNGAKPSATLNNLLIKEGIIKGDKMVSWKPKKKEEVIEKPSTVVKPTAPKTEETPKEAEPENKEQSEVVEPQAEQQKEEAPIEEAKEDKPEEKLEVKSE